MLIYGAQLSGATQSLQRQSITQASSLNPRIGCTGIRCHHSRRLLWNRSTLHRSVGQTSVGGAIGCSLRLERLKNVTILGLPWVRFAPHVVCPQGRIPSILLLTVIDD